MTEYPNLKKELAKRTGKEIGKMLIIMEVEWFVCMWGFIVLIFLLSCVFESFNKMFKIKTEIIDCLEIIRNEMPAYLNLSAIKFCSVRSECPLMC